MIKVGVIGAGHLGKIHLNILNNSDFELVGFHDTDVFNSEKLTQEKGYSFFKEIHLLIEKIDAAVIVSPTTTHFEIAKECINKGKHIFVEKPLTCLLYTSVLRKHKIEVWYPDPVPISKIFSLLTGFNN